MIKRFLKQTAVYWGAPTPDGRGGYTYGDPVEVPCRWTVKKEVLTTGDGEQVVSQSEVWLAGSIDEGGMLYLGTLDELDSAPTPQDSGALKIKVAAQIPSVNAQETMYKAYLYEGKV